MEEIAQDNSQQHGTGSDFHWELAKGSQETKAAQAGKGTIPSRPFGQEDPADDDKQSGKEPPGTN